MQNSNEIVAIVPNLPPMIDGIGDYGLNLARQLYHDFGWKTRFIVGSPEWQGEAGEFFQATPVPVRSPKALAALLPSPNAIVLLHYAGHGYARRGCPIWLVQALAQWCRAGGRLITMFHELYATRPLLSSAILTSPIQKKLAVQLMKMSDRVLTNCQSYAEKISSLSHQKHTNVVSLPVLSTIGEIQYPKSLQERSRELVIFGSSSLRQRIYQQGRSLLEQVCQQLNIQAIIDIGAAIDLKLDYLNKVPISRLGIQPAEQISCILSNAIAGVMSYPTAYLAKSSIFAGYCAHGVLPVVLSSELQNQDKLEMNYHYWLADQRIDLTQAQAIATAGHAWYQSHNLEAQSQRFAEYLGEFRLKAYLNSQS